MPVVSPSKSGSLPSQWTVGSHGELTIAPTGGFAPVLTLQAAPGQLADGDELFSIKNDTPVQVFGVDAMGGVGIAMLSAPFSGDTGVSVDGVGPLVEVQTTGASSLSALRSVTGFHTKAILVGALPTIAPVSGTSFLCSATRDVTLVVPFTGDATNNAATLKIELSPDNVTYSTLDTLSIAAALNLTGAINTPVTLQVPGGWRVKLTATHGTIGTATIY